VRATPWLRAALVGGFLAAAIVPAWPAWAHSQLISMSPADGSTVSVAPKQVVLSFDENIQRIGDAVAVTGPDGSRVDDGPPAILGATATEKLRNLVYRGHYTVSYRVVSDDGHPVTRTLGFYLATGKPPQPVAAAGGSTPHAASADRSALTALLAAGLALVAVGLVGVRLRLGRRAR
jgi:copper resistance protein C